MNETVSIISPCYNEEKYLPDFLESVLKQTYEKIELFLVDDGSTDTSLQIARRYKKKFEKSGKELIIISQPNRGQAAAINQGLKRFSGDYLMWVDSDDILFNEHVKRKVEFL